MLGPSRRLAFTVGADVNLGWGLGHVCCLRALAPQHSCPSRLLGCCRSPLLRPGPEVKPFLGRKWRRSCIRVTWASLGVCNLSEQNRVSSPGAGGPRAVATAGNQGGGQDRAEAGSEPGRASWGVYGEGGVNSGFRCGVPGLNLQMEDSGTECTGSRAWGSGWYD